MGLQAFFDNFAQLADGPNSVAKLRELILQFALQGKLIPQNPGDGPSSDLLEKVTAERNRFVKERKIKKLREIEKGYLPSINSHIPVGWQVEWLGNLAHAITKGATPTTYGHVFQSEGIRFVKVENVKKNQIVTESITDFISEEAHNSQTRSQLKAGDVLFSIAGTIGETCIVKESDLPANTNQALAIIRGTEGVFQPEFLKLQLDSFVANAIRDKARGGAMNNVSLGDLKELLVHIPPLEEQKRIVAKVDQLMRFCDELEALQQQKRASRGRLNNTALAPLNNAASLTSEEFAQATTRLGNNFDTLYDSAETVSSLRSTILQLAVQGKLVPQDPNDEPTLALLSEIRKEKVRQLQEKKSKQIEPLRAIRKTDILNRPAPDGWEWAWLGDLARFVDYRGKTPPKTDSGVKLITAKNVRMGFISEHPREFISEKTYTEVMTRGLPKFGDILFTTEAPLGNVAQLLTEGKVALAQRVIDLQTFEPLFAEYLKVCLMSPLMQEAIAERATGMTATGIKASKLKLLPIPVPPLAEQKRIVAKVNQLMALCDELEAKLNQAEADSEKLMNAAVQHVLKSVSEQEKTIDLFNSTNAA